MVTSPTEWPVSTPSPSSRIVKRTSESPNGSVFWLSMRSSRGSAGCSRHGGSASSRPVRRAAATRAVSSRPGRRTRRGESRRARRARSGGRRSRRRSWRSPLALRGDECRARRATAHCKVPRSESTTLARARLYFPLFFAVGAVLMNGQGIRRVAIVGGIRIPFCRAYTAYARCSNQDMMTAVLKALVVNATGSRAKGSATCRSAR